MTQDYWYGQTAEPNENADKDYKIVEVAYNPGVTDPVRDSVMKAIKDLGILNVHAVATAKRYLLRGISVRVNWIPYPAVCWSIPSSSMSSMRSCLHSPENPQYTFAYVKVPVIDRSEEELEKVRKQYGFSEKEFQAVLDYFQKAGRDPIDVETGNPGPDLVGTLRP